MASEKSLIAIVLIVGILSMGFMLIGTGTVDLTGITGLTTGEINEAPIYTGAELSTSANTPLVVDLSEYFTDPDSNELTFIAAQEDVVTVSIAGSIATFVPAEGFTGERTLTIIATDGENIVKAPVKLNVGSGASSVEPAQEEPSLVEETIQEESIPEVESIIEEPETAQESSEPEPPAEQSGGGFGGQGFSTQTNVSGCSTINDTTVLNTSINNAVGVCITIAGDNLVFSCAGNTIDGNSAANSIGIRASGRTNVTVRDCIIREFDKNIEFVFTTNSLVTNVSSTNPRETTFFSEIHAMHFSATNHSRIENSTFVKILELGITGSITLSNNSNNNTVFNNNASIFGNGTGILIDRSHNNTIIGNNATVNMSARGIRLMFNATDNVVADNFVVPGTDPTLCAGISLLTDVFRTTVRNNTIIGLDRPCSGLELNHIFNNTFINNLVHMGPGPTRAAVVMSTSVAAAAPNSTDNLFANNTFIATNGTGIGYDRSVRNTFINNTIVTNTGIGIDIDDSNFQIGNNIFRNTTLFSNATWIRAELNIRQNEFYNTKFASSDGSIRIFSNFTMQPASPIIDFNRSKLNTSFNRAFLNSSNLPFLNQSAQITLNGIDFNFLQPIVDFNDDGIFAACPGTICRNVSIIPGVAYVFNVTQFTTYSSQDANMISDCATINQSSSLTQNIASNDTCIIVNASNVKLNCQGFTIGFNANNGTDEYGINISNVNNATVQNCIIRDLNNSPSGANVYGISLLRSNGSMIINNTFLRNGSGSGVGNINSNLINATTIANNTFIDGAVSLGTNSGSNNVTGNNFTNSTLNAEGSNEFLRYNTLVGAGIVAQSGTGTWQFNNITIINDVNSAIAMNTDPAGPFLIDNNRIIVSSNGTTVEALRDASTTINLTNNTIIVNGTGSRLAEAIAIQASSQMIAVKNNITLDGNSVAVNFEFVVLNTSRFEGNTITALSGSSWLNSSSLSTPTSFVNFTNTTFRTLSGSIHYHNLFQYNVSEDLNRGKFNISFNEAFVNSSDVPSLNASAQITLTGLSSTQALPRVDFEDDGTFVLCPSSVCTSVSSSGGSFVFNVTQFTSFSSTEGNVSITLTKTDSPDPVTVGSQLNYTIIVNVTSDNPQNITLTDIYPDQVIFQSAQPTPLSGTNNTFIIGNISAGEAFIVNISVLVQSGLANNTLMNNTANISFQNLTGSFLNITVTESTTAEVPPLACPITINQTTTLTSSLQSNGTCITIGGDNMTLDCGGFTIIYGQNGTRNDTMGINISNRNNVTVRNCNIRKGNTTGGFRSYGIGIFNVTSPVISNNTVLTNGSEDNDGIHARSSVFAKNEIVKNNGNINTPFCTNTTSGVGQCNTCFTTGGVDCAVFLQKGCTDGEGFKTDTLVRFNVTSQPIDGFIKALGGEKVICRLNDAVIMEFRVRNNCGVLSQQNIPASAFILNAENNLTCSVSGGGEEEDNGFKLTEFSYTVELPVSGGALIANNTILANGGNFSDGIFGEIANSTIEGNNITTRGIRFGHGINMQALGSQNNISLNSIHVLTNASDGIRLERNALNVLTNNTLIAATASLVNLQRAMGQTFNRSIIPLSATRSSLLVAEVDGEINFTIALNLTNDVFLPDVMNISLNSTHINTTDLDGRQLNGSAVLLFFNIPIDAPDARPLVDLEDDGTFSGCFSPRCTQTSYNRSSGIFKMNVSSFTTYAATPISDCETLDLDFNVSAETFELLNNVTGLASCYNIVSDNISLLCNGFPIFYGASGGNRATGVGVTNANNVTVRDCLIRDINAGGDRSIAINASNVSRLTLYNNTLITNGTSNNFGLALPSVNNSLVENQSINTFGTSSINTGIDLRGNSGNITIFNNTIITNGTGNSDGMNIINSEEIKVMNNTIRTSLGGSGNQGLFFRVARGVIGFNKIFTNGTLDNDGIEMSGGNGHGTRIENNTIVTGGSSSGNRGIDSQIMANITIRYNSINTTGTSANYGIFMSGSTPDSLHNNITRNNISTRGTSTNNEGILLQTADHNRVVDNFIITNGTSSNDGIQLAGTSSNNTIENNTIITGSSQGTQNSGVVILASDSVLGHNNVTNNTINTTGAGDNNYGVLISQSGNSGQSFNNIVRLNLIHTRGNSSNYGVFLENDVHNNNITNNTIITNTSIANGNSNTGIRFSGDGDTSDRLSHNNTAEFNNITTFGTGLGANYGIHLRNLQEDDKLIQNLITARGDNDTYGIFLESETNRTLVEHNNITLLTTGVNNTGIRLSDAHASIIRRNNISNNVSIFDIIIGLFSGANTNFISNNTIYYTNGTGIKIVSSNFNDIRDQNVSVPLASALSVAGTANNFTNTLFTSDRGTAVDFIPGTAAGTFSDGFEDGNLAPFTSSGNADWIINNTAPFSGTFSAQAGPIDHSQTSSLILSLPVGPGTISFARRVSSETSFDFLRFFIDGSQQIQWSGNLPYAVFNFTFTGATTFEWRYVKDNIADGFLDTAFIDDVNITFGASGNTNNTFDITTLLTNNTWIFMGAGNTNNSVKNTTFVGYNGSINILPQVNITDGTNITLGNLNNTGNLTFLNSTNLTAFNTTAILTFQQANFLDPVPVRDVEDDRTFVLCRNTSGGHCNELVDTDTLYAYNVSGFTFYSIEEGNVNLSVNKTDNVDPINQSSELNYTITLNNSGTTTAFNFTVTETYPAQVIFVSASPTPDSGTNNTFTIGTLPIDTEIAINISVFVINVTGNITINNSALVSFLNASNVTVNATVSESTNVSGNGTAPPPPPPPAPAPAAGGGSGGRGNIIVREPQVEAPAVCLENWACEGWSSCQNGVQTRLCIDLNRCNSTQYLPALQRSCEAAPARTPMLILEPLKPAVDLFKASLWPIVFIIIGIVLVTFSLWTLSQHRGQPKPPRVAPKVLLIPRRPTAPINIQKKAPKQEFYGKLDDIDKKLSDVEKHPPKVKVVPVKHAKLEMPKVKPKPIVVPAVPKSLKTPAKPKRTFQFPALFKSRPKPKIAHLKSFSIHAPKAAPIKISNDHAKFKKKMSSFDKELDKLDRKLKKKK